MEFALIIAAVGIALLVSRIRDMTAEADTVRRDLARLKEERAAIYNLLHDLGEAFTRSPDLASLMHIVAESSLRITQAKGAAVLEIPAGDAPARVLAVAGAFPPFHEISREALDKIAERQDFLEATLKSHPVPRDGELIRRVLGSGSVLVPDTTKQPMVPAHDHPQLRWQSLMAVALRYHGEDFGILVAANSKRAGSFTLTDYETLQSVGNQATFSMHNSRVYGELLEKRRLDHEVEVAREIQRLLLPVTSPEVPGWEIEAVNFPAREVSGDYYDFIPLAGGRFGLVVADVSGKGVPASLVMTMCRTVIRSHAHLSTSAAEVLRGVNRQLYPDIREDMFVTVTYAILDPAEKRVVLARAGHEAPIFFRKGQVEVVRTPGMAIGIDSGEVFDTVIADSTFQFESGDAFVLYTDGVTEALNPEGEEFGRECLMDIIRNSASGGAEAVLQEITAQLDGFRSTAEKYDDITLITAYAK